jgi:hypothetical protein
MVGPNGRRSLHETGAPAYRDQARRIAANIALMCTAPKSNHVAEPYCIGIIEGISSLLELNGAIAQHEPTFRDREVICTTLPTLSLAILLAT